MSNSDNLPTSKKLVFYFKFYFLINNYTILYRSFNLNRLFTVLLILVFIGCKKDKKVWEASFQGVSSSSSPQCADLNADGVKDIVIGAGGEEWTKTEKGILAINGATGALLWQAKARNQIVGSALFYDINKDKTVDVIIGGRSAELQALDGKTGKLIWEFYSKPGKFTAHDNGWLNFFNAQLVLDQNQDDIKDILVCNGGDALLAAGSKNRPAGKLLLISGKTGEILAEDLMPDGSETYFTPVCFDCETNPNPKFVFGSGGETHGGHLYLANLNLLKTKKLKIATVLDSSNHKGYIAPPILVDINNDKSLDILVNLVDGTTKLINGNTLNLLWSIKKKASEVYSQPAIGYFYGDDKILDVFVNYAYGTYPTFSKTESFLIDGKNGQIVGNFPSLRFTYSSPLVADLDMDGVDEVILNTILEYKEGEKQKPFFQLTTFNFKNNKQSYLAEKKNGACFASTPWLGDLDTDGKLDLIYTGSPATISEFPGSTTYVKPPIILNMYHFKFPETPSKSVKWGNYLGSNSTSIFQK